MCPVHAFCRWLIGWPWLITLLRCVFCTEKLLLWLLYWYTILFKAFEGFSEYITVNLLQSCNLFFYSVWLVFERGQIYKLLHCPRVKWHACEVYHLHFLLGYLTLMPILCLMWFIINFRQTCLLVNSGMTEKCQLHVLPVHGFHPSGSSWPQSSQFDRWIPWIVKAEPKKLWDRWRVTRLGTNWKYGRVKFLVLVFIVAKMHFCVVAYDNILGL